MTNIQREELHQQARQLISSSVDADELDHLAQELVDQIEPGPGQKQRLHLLASAVQLGQWHWLQDPGLKEASTHY